MKTFKMKKIIAFILTFVLILALVGCDKADKQNPTLTNGDQELASFTENGVKYAVTNQEVYNALKAQFGSTVLTNMIDTKLLKSVKNDNNQNYYDAVTEEEIKEEIDSVMYGDDELTDEEKAEKKETFLENLFTGSGILTTDPYSSEVQEKYRLSLAQEKYAYDLLAKEVKEHNEKYEAYKKLSKEEQEKLVEEEPETPTSLYYADTKVVAKYNKDVYSKFEAIVVPFTSNRQARIALAQIGVVVENGVWTDGTEPLTAIEVYNKFIELYKVVYGYKVTGELNKDSEEFKFAESDLESEIVTELKDKLESYTNDSTNVNPNWYTPVALEIGSGDEYVYVLKFNAEIATAFVDLSDEEKDVQRAKYLSDIISDSITTNYINTCMANLRKDNNIIIYDSVVESLYSTTVSKLSVEYKATKAENASVVAELDNITITADELFEALLKYQGAAIVMDKLAEKRALYNKDFNKYYDMSTQKWLDTDKKKEMEALITAEKKNFKNGNYKDYGYDPDSITWDLFIRSLYGVEDEDELLLAFLAEAITSEYSASINPVSEMDDEGKFVISNANAEETDYWKLINEKMNAEANAKFSVDGIHLLVAHYATVEDYINGNDVVDPEEWTEEQRTAAEELVNEVIAFVKDSTGTYDSRLERIAEAYKYAPVKNSAVQFNGNDVALSITSDGGNATINLSRYKELGLYVKYESLGVFTQGKMVEAFNDAVKEIWDADVLKDVFNDATINEVDKVTVLETPIKTSFGYHAYINIESKEITYIKMESVTTSDNVSYHSYQYVPTLEQVRTYLENTNTTEITEKAKTAVKNYYVVIADELSGDTFTQIMMFNALNSVIDSYNTNSSSVSKDVVAKYIAAYQDYAFESSLTYVTSDYIYLK